MPEKIRKKTNERLFSVLLFLLLLLFLFSVPLWKKEVCHAVIVCGVSLIPVLFPFLILSDLLLHTAAGQALLSLLSLPFARVLRTSRAGGCAYLIGILLGFPLGVKAICAYYKNGMLEKNEAERLLLFCNNTGPAFLIGSVGGMLGNASQGLLLYLIQLLISLLCGILLVPKKENRKEHIAAAPGAKGRNFSFPASVRKASTQMLSICGYVLFFSALCAMLSPLLPILPAQAFLAAILEIGSGTAFITGKLNSPLKLPFCGLATCFSGLSVFFQAKEFLLETNLSSTRVLPAKLLQGMGAFLLLLLLEYTGLVG